MAAAAAGDDLNVAIIGGGIAGLTLAIGLQARGIPFTLYERAASFREIGAGIGFSANAEAAMQRLDPDMHAAFRKAITPNGEDYFKWVDGHRTDKLMYQLWLGDDGFPGARRSDILEVWVELVDKSRVRFGMEIADIKDDDDDTGVKLTFQDGTVEKADVGKTFNPS